MMHAGIRPFEHGPPRLANCKSVRNTNHGDVAQVYYKSPRSLEITFHTRNGQGRREFFCHVAGPRPKLAAFRRERGAAVEQTRNKHHLSGSLLRRPLHDIHCDIIIVFALPLAVPAIATNERVRLA